MITVSLEEIINAIPAFKILMQSPCDGKNAFKIARLYREIEKELNLFEQERKKFIEKYSEKKTDGSIKQNKDGNIQIQSDHINEFNQAMDEMLKSIIDINAEPVSIDILMNLTLTPEQAFSLEKFFE